MVKTKVYAFILNFMWVVYVFDFKFKNSPSLSIAEIFKNFADLIKVRKYKKQHVKSEKKNNKEIFVIK